MVNARTGAEVLIAQLIAQGVDRIFCVPGESYLAVLDVLHDAAIQIIVCRQEGGAAMMAEAYGKLTGKPGVCFVTRGPGATNASPGLHVARQDSTPLILFIGQVERGLREREAFQEIDFRAMYGSIGKWVTEVETASRFPELVSRAFHIATSDRPGPVVMSLPEDVLTETSEVIDALPATAIEAYPSSAQMNELQALLDAAERPVAIVGGTRWSAVAVREFREFADSFELPVYCSFRRQMLFDHEHRCYAGDLGLGANQKAIKRIKDADLVLLAGGRLSEVPSQHYSLLDIPNPKPLLVHIHPDPAELGRVYRPHLAIPAAPAAFSAALNFLRPPNPIRWSQQTQQAHEDYLEWSNLDTITTPGALKMTEVMRILARTLPPDAIVTNGAGNFAAWVHRFWRFRSFGTQLAPISGSMGYSIPSAVAAKQLYPTRTVIAFSGDGDFLMNGQEFATAVQYELPILVIIVDNGMYGTIRMHQEQKYPGRVVATNLKNPDFASYARAFGGYGERVERTEQFEPALQRAIASGQPAILHCLIDPEAITPSATLTAMREKALALRANPP